MLVVVRLEAIFDTPPVASKNDNAMASKVVKRG